MSHPKVVVVIPTYNERESLPSLVICIEAVGVPNLHMTIVDDDSPDGTGRLADELAAERPELVSVVHRPAKDGLGRAYLAGMRRALDDGADIVVQMDADLSHPPSAIPTMIALLWRADADVVIGSRYVDGGAIGADWPWSRRLLSRWANFYVNGVLRLGVNDATAGFKGWRADSLRAVDLNTVRSNGYSFQVEMNHRAVTRGLRIAEIPITFADRTQGTSKMTLRVQLESAVLPWVLLVRARRKRRTRPETIDIPANHGTRQSAECAHAAVDRVQARTTPN